MATTRKKGANSTADRASDRGETASTVEPELLLDNEEEEEELDLVSPDESGEKSSTGELLPSAIPPVLDLVGAHAESASDSVSPVTGELVKYDPLQSYLSEIRHLPSLSREEEHELAVKFFESKDPKAGYKLVLANLRLVVMIAREYQRNVQNILDLVQEGNIGLLEAVKQYDPYKGVRFPSYAVYWVRAYMLRYLINNLRLVKIGTTQAQRKLFFNLQKEKEKLEAEGFVPEARLLADRLNVKESEVLEMEQRLALPDLSVDAPIAGTEDGLDFHNIFADLGPNAEELVAEGDFTQRLRSAVDEFKSKLADDKERAIIDQRLFTEEPATLQAIAEQFNLSRERIRQIESRLKEELKLYLSEKLQLGDSGEVTVQEVEDQS